MRVQCLIVISRFNVYECDPSLARTNSKVSLPSLPILLYSFVPLQRYLTVENEFLPSPHETLNHFGFLLVRMRSYRLSVVIVTTFYPLELVVAFSFTRETSTTPPPSGRRGSRHHGITSPENTRKVGCYGNRVDTTTGSARAVQCTCKVWHVGRIHILCAQACARGWVPTTSGKNARARVRDGSKGSGRR